MAEAADNLVAFWNGMEIRSRVGLILGIVFVIVGVSLLSWWIFKRDYQTLFTGLEERDGAAIVTELKRLKVPYRLDAGGTTIKVPADVVHETRLSLMGHGVNLSGGVGFEIFDNKDLGMTEYTQKINYQRALQGELVRTIAAIDDVKSARVHLVLPDASIFKRDKSRSKASVSLVLKPGGRLTPEQILGIQRLVSAAAPGLDPGMVTVLDQRGVALSAVSDGDGTTVSGSSQLRVKQEVEQYLTRKAGQVLDRSFGPGQAIVSIDALLNFDEVRRTVQDVVPARGDGESSGVMVRKRQTQQNQARAAGIAKADNDYRQDAGDPGNTSSTLEVDYDVSRRMEQVVTTPGGLRRLSVGVLVPNGVGDEQRARIRSLVAMAVGLDERRGDAIVVHGLDNATAGALRPGLAAEDTQDPADPLGKPATQGAEWLFGLPTATAVILLVGAGILLGMVLARGIARRARLVSAVRGARTQDERRQEMLGEIKQWLQARTQASTDDAKPGTAS